VAIASGLDYGTHRRSCPQCSRGPRDKTFSVTVAPGEAILFHCHRCGFSGRVHADKMALAATTRVAKRHNDMPRYQTLSDSAAAFWAACKPLIGTIAERYLLSRNCVIPSAEAHLRYSANAYHWLTKTQRPAMVALVTDFADSTIYRSLHFTFLKPDGSGKADLQPAKLLLPRHTKKNGVIRLCADSDVCHGLALAEGIETALSAAHIFTPVWACVDAGNLAALPVVDGIESLTIFADSDLVGLTSANELAVRWAQAGRLVKVRVPREEKQDINDIVSAVS